MQKVRVPGVHLVEPRGLPSGYGSAAKIANDEHTQAFLVFLGQQREAERKEDAELRAYGRQSSPLTLQPYPTDDEIDQLAHEFVYQDRSKRETKRLAKKWMKEPTWDELFEGRGTGKYEYLLYLQRNAATLRRVRLWANPQTAMNPTALPLDVAARSVVAIRRATRDDGSKLSISANPGKPNIVWENGLPKIVAPSTPITAPSTVASKPAARTAAARQPSVRKRGPSSVTPTTTPVGTTKIVWRNGTPTLVRT